MFKPFILVVDDEKDVANEISDILSDTGEFQVDRTYSGEEAIRKIKAKDYDIILLDIRMPKISGIEVLKEIGKMGKNAETVMITALDDAKSAWDAAKAGAYDYIIKPFRNEELVLRIKMAARRHERMTQLNRELDFATEFLRLLREDPEEYKKINSEWTEFKDRKHIEHPSMTPKELSIVMSVRKEDPKWYLKDIDLSQAGLS